MSQNAFDMMNSQNAAFQQMLGGQQTGLGNTGLGFLNTDPYANQFLHEVEMRRRLNLDPSIAVHRVIDDPPAPKTYRQKLQAEVDIWLKG